MPCERGSRVHTLLSPRSWVSRTRISGENNAAESLFPFRSGGSCRSRIRCCGGWGRDSPRSARRQRTIPPTGSAGGRPPRRNSPKERISPGSPCLLQGYAIAAPARGTSQGHRVDDRKTGDGEIRTSGTRNEGSLAPEEKGGDQESPSQKQGHARAGRSQMTIQPAPSKTLIMET